MEERTMGHSTHRNVTEKRGPDLGLADGCQERNASGLDRPNLKSTSKDLGLMISFVNIYRLKCVKIQIKIWNTTKKITNNHESNRLFIFIRKVCTPLAAAANSDEWREFKALRRAESANSDNGLHLRFAEDFMSTEQARGTRGASSA